MPQHLAVLLPNWIGDVVMATPTLRALREGLGPDVSITAVIAALCLPSAHRDRVV